MGLSYALAKRVTATPFQETVVELTRQIDNLLFKLGGIGRNIDERANSLRHVLNAQEARRLQLVTKVNRRMIYNGGFTIKRAHHRFIRTCGWMIYRLETHLATHAPRQRPTNSRSHSLFTIGACTLGLLVAVLVSTHPRGHTGWNHLSVHDVTRLPWVIALFIIMFLAVRFIVKRR